MAIGPRGITVFSQVPLLTGNFPSNALTRLKRIFRDDLSCFLFGAFQQICRQILFIYFFILFFLFLFLLLLLLCGTIDSLVVS